jgi:hypothetical protein
LVSYRANKYLDFSCQDFCQSWFGYNCKFFYCLLDWIIHDRHGVINIMIELRSIIELVCSH